MPKNWSPLEKALIRTLIYADIFSGTLTLKEVQRYVLDEQVFTQEEIRSGLVALRKVMQTKDLVERVYLGEVARHFPAGKWRAITSLVRLLSPIPWIESIWITGSVAVGNSRASDDIDVLFIVSPQRLWITRFLVVSLGTLLRKYRHSGLSSEKLADRWCCNIWMESDSLFVYRDRQDVYTAREIVQAIPVYRRWDIPATAWLKKNDWVQMWTQSGYNASLQRAENTYTLPTSVFFKTLTSSVIVSALLSWINVWVFYVQMLSIQRKKTKEVVSKKTAFFHPGNTHEHVLKAYQKKCQEYGV